MLTDRQKREVRERLDEIDRQTSRLRAGLRAGDIDEVLGAAETIEVEADGIQQRVSR